MQHRAPVQMRTQSDIGGVSTLSLKKKRRSLAVISITLILLLQLFVGSLYVEPEILQQDGAEWSLNHDEVWTEENWSVLEDEGFRFLRQPKPTMIIAWVDSETTPTQNFISAEVNVSPVVKSEWRGDYQTRSEYWKIVLEPRLPYTEVANIVELLAGMNLNGTVLIQPADFLPLSTIIQISSPESPELIEWLFNLQGIWWFEPILPTVGRDSVVASVIQTGAGVTSGNENHPAWLLGLNGDGVIVGVADSGIDLDHACFRNASSANEIGSEGEGGLDLIGVPNEYHRSVIALNDSIDDWDDDSQDFGHGTHIAGILGCRDIFRYRAAERGDIINSTPLEMASLSYKTRLLIQDVVADDAWLEPDFDWLLAEAFEDGAIIHSDSWGDATEAYTQRSADLDAWSVEVPWSLVFIAPGNSGSKFYEPANARNVVATAASLRNGGLDILASSATGPTEEGLRGNFITTPGISILSAASDGLRTTYNNGTSQKTGTSFSTPVAASTAAVIQQMVESGWLHGIENTTTHQTENVRPIWANMTNENISSNGSLLFGPGHSPSGALLRALLALSATPLKGGHHGATLLSDGPDNHQGWGRPSLNNLVNFTTIESALTNNTDHDPSPNLWLHDSFQLNTTPSLLAEEWLTAPGQRPLENVVAHIWNGSGAMGPFLGRDENSTWNITWDGVSDLDILLSYSPRPFGLAPDDLDLIVTLPDGRVAHGNDLIDGWSRLRSSANLTATDTLEGTERIRISAQHLSTSGTIELKIVATTVGIGAEPDSIGLDGNRLGFAIAAKGIIRDNVSNTNFREGGEEGDGTEDGDENNSTVIDNVTNHPPSISIIYPNDNTISVDEIYVEWFATDAEGDQMLANISLIHWNGDYSEIVGAGCQAYSMNNSLTNCTIQVPISEENRTGVWSVKIHIIDLQAGIAMGSTVVQSAQFEISEAPLDCPLCELVVSIPKRIHIFETVNMSVDPSNTPGWKRWGDATIEWDFGDGANAGGWLVEHTYTSDPASGMAMGPRSQIVTVCISFTGGITECHIETILIDVEPGYENTQAVVPSPIMLIPIFIGFTIIPITAYLFGRSSEHSFSKSTSNIPPPFEEE
jgi:subtilisin family serine protease